MNSFCKSHRLRHSCHCATNVYKLNSRCSQARFIRMKSASKKRAPTIVNLTVKRRYLTEREVERLMDCARKHGRYGHRDATSNRSRSSYPRVACMCTTSRTGLPAYIRSAVTRYVLFVSYAATTSKMPTYSFASAAGQSVLLASTASSSASARLPTCHSRSTHTCFATPWVQARQRWPRHAGVAALPRA